MTTMYRSKFVLILRRDATAKEEKRGNEERTLLHHSHEHNSSIEFFDLVALTATIEY